MSACVFINPHSSQPLVRIGNNLTFSKKLFEEILNFGMLQGLFDMFVSLHFLIEEKLPMFPIYDSCIICILDAF